mmetsp:Transcript_29599/g.87742  ORF Transcript_29599/g.87742 Transcript_29599/m.87742 type:complete len:85 (+) Transcript_29599:2745-2999(+)
MGVTVKVEAARTPPPAADRRSVRWFGSLWEDTSHVAEPGREAGVAGSPWLRNGLVNVERDRFHPAAEDVLILATALAVDITIRK